MPINASGSHRPSPYGDSPSIEVVLCQWEPVAGSIASNVQRVLQGLGEQPDAELMVFPELFLTGYDPNSVGFPELGLSAASPEIDALRGAAKEQATALMVGLAEREGDHLFSSVLAIDSDGALR